MSPIALNTFSPCNPISQSGKNPSGSKFLIHKIKLVSL